MKIVFLFLICFSLAFCLLADPNDGASAGLIENFEDGQTCFQWPTYSGTSTGHLAGYIYEIVDYRSNWRLDPEAAWYVEEDPGSHSQRLGWTWDAASAEAYKIRITSSGRANARNDITGSWQFKIWDNAGVGFYYYYVGEPVWVAVSVREDPVGDANIYEMTTFQELIPEPDWQYMYFDFSEPGIFADSFWVDEALGNGVLDTAEPLLESLFFVPVGGMDVDLEENLPVAFFIDDVHYGPPHTPADPPTSAGSWSLFF